MYPVSDGQKFDWSCTNRRQVEGVLWRLVPWCRRERNWTRILRARASTTSFRGCSCHPSDSKSLSQRSWWGPSRTVQSRRRDKVMASDGIVCYILIQNKQHEQMDTFLYLGSLITKDGECTTKLHTRWNGVGDRGVTAENMEKSQHTDWNEDTTNESACVVCSNVQLWKLDTQKEWRNTSWCLWY